MKKVDQCFVLMPFTVKEVDRTTYSDLNHCAEVYEGLIRPAVELAGIQCARDDDDTGSRDISDEIFRKIETADMILCDMSSQNSNVFLELGWAFRGDKPYVLLVDDKTISPFDLLQRYTFTYDHRLQPIILRKEILLLSQVIRKTLSDTGARYSLVKRLSASLGIIEAAATGDSQSGYLLEILELVRSLHVEPRQVSGGTMSFVWPEILLRGTELLNFSLSYLLNSDLTSSTFASEFRNQLRSIDRVGDPELQVSVVGSDRTYLFHDWERLIGRPALWASIDGDNIYDNVFSYRVGAVAWIDRSSNIVRRRAEIDKRFNIALFSIVDGSDFRVVVEMHQELRRPE